MIPRSEDEQLGRKCIDEEYDDGVDSNIVRMCVCCVRYVYLNVKFSMRDYPTDETLYTGDIRMLSRQQNRFLNATRIK